MMLDWNQAVGVTRPSAVDTPIQMATGFHAKAIARIVPITQPLPASKTADHYRSAA